MARPERDPGPSELPGRRAGAGLWVLAVVLLAALLPSLGTLGAPHVSEDATILGHVHRAGAWSDWVQPQYGLHTLRFWRPLVSLSWDLQERLSGTAPLPLRLYNLACHAAAALLAAALAARLGAGRLGALAAGLAAALFPEQGGTVTWLAGRTDGTCSPLLLGALLLAVNGRARLAALTAFLACAAKEMAFVLPVWGALLLWAQEPRRGAALRPFLGLLAGTLVAFVWRRLAVGSFLGGYPAPPVDPAGLARAASTWASAASWSLGGVLLLGALGLALGSARPRLLAAGLGCAVAGALPLVSLLVDGVLEPTNLRTLRISDLGLALALAAAVARPPRRLLPASVGRALLFLGCALLLGWRGRAAWRDTHEWAAAGARAAAETARAREVVAAGPRSSHPWLSDGFSPTWGGAYCLAFGVADRFRPPFEPARRPIWPLRPIFAHPGSRRAPVVPVESVTATERDPTEVRWIQPLERPSRLPRLDVLDLAGAPLTSLVLDERAAHEPDESPRLAIRGLPPRARLELLVYTEVGYEPAPAPHAAEVDRALVLSLRQVLLASSGRASLAEALTQAADLGATRAYLELRALGSDGGVVAASPWLELTWAPDLFARVLGR